MSPSQSDDLVYRAVEASFPGWALLQVTGRHRERFLHSQVTSDLRELGVGESQLSALLDASGRLKSFFFLHKLEDRFELLLPEEAADATAERLMEHIIADDVRIERRAVPAMRLVLGPEAVRLAERLPSDDRVPVEGFGSRGMVTWADEVPDFVQIDERELETRRVLSGLPRWAYDLGDGTLINESLLFETAVSLSKGCFLGQETVAKVASRRGAARYPVLLRLHGETVDLSTAVGSSFAVGDSKRAGTVHAVVRWDGSTYLEASVIRALRVEGMELDCRFTDGSELAATVVSLPLIKTPEREEDAERLYLRAVRLFAEDDDEAAIELLRRAIAVCPSYGDAYESLGVILGRRGRYPEAIELMQKLLEIDPESVMAHTNMSLYFNQLGRIDEAETQARLAAAKALERDRRERAHADGERLKEQHVEEDRRKREEMFRQVLELDPGDGLANFGMGELCVETGRFEAAIAHLERAIELDPKHSAAYLVLGRAWEGANQIGRARETYAYGIEVAARRGDLMTANRMQERLLAMESEKS